MVSEMGELYNFGAPRVIIGFVALHRLALFTPTHWEGRVHLGMVDFLGGRDRLQVVIAEIEIKSLSYIPVDKI